MAKRGVRGAEPPVEKKRGVRGAGPPDREYFFQLQKFSIRFVLVRLGFFFLKNKKKIKNLKIFLIYYFVQN